jgi:hypothetical protein
MTSTFVPEAASSRWAFIGSFRDYGNGVDFLGGRPGIEELEVKPHEENVLQ